MPRIVVVVLVAVVALLSSACTSSGSSEQNPLGLTGSQMGSIALDMGRCSSVIEGGKVVTAEDIQACKDSVITMGYECNDGNDLVMIGIEEITWAIRVGSAPVGLSEGYTFDEMATACGDSAPFP